MSIEEGGQTDSAPQEAKMRLLRKELVARFEQLRVPPELVDPHPLTSKTIACFARMKREREKADATKPKANLPYWQPDFSDMRGPQAKYGRYTPRLGSESYAITASFTTVDRAVRIFDVVVKALEAEGFKIESRMHKDGTRAVKDGEYLAFRITEGYAQRPVPQSETASGRAPCPTGNLDVVRVCGVTSGERRWRDRDKPLEEQLPNILADFVAHHSAQKALRAQREQEAREKGRRQARLEAELSQRRAEDQELRDLAEEAQQEQTVQTTLTYLDFIEQEAGTLDTCDQEKLAEWLKRKRRQLDAERPVRRRVAKVLRLEEVSGGGRNA